MKRYKLSAVILTQNEEKNIEDCISKLNFCDEIIVIDDYSNDKTAIIAQNSGAKVYFRTLDDNFASQRNFGLKKAKYDWVLFVDADEIVTNELKQEIIEFISNDNQKYNAAKFTRKNFFLGKQMNYGEFGNNKLIRLGRRNKGNWQRRIHEYWDIKGSLYMFKNPLLHNSPQALNEYISKINRYTDWHALENLHEGKQSSLIKILIFPIGKFVNNYFLKMGFRDGTYGFVSSMLMSFHSYLSWSKLWQKQRQK